MEWEKEQEKWDVQNCMVYPPQNHILPVCFYRPDNLSVDWDFFGNLFPWVGILEKHCRIYRKSAPLVHDFRRRTGCRGGLFQLGRRIFCLGCKLSARAVLHGSDATLYKWVYPRFGENFLFSMGLLLGCVYEGIFGSANPSRGIYFLLADSSAPHTYLNMCWTLTFDTAKSRNSVLSYIITKIHDPDEQGRGLTAVWKQRLLKDCYDCLKSQYYKNLEVILNDSLIWNHRNIPSIFFNSALRDETANPAEVEIRLLFLRKQLSAWNDILSGHEPAGRANLLLLDVKRLRQELRGEFLPKFKLSGHTKVFDREDYGKTDLRPSRAAWFLAFLFHSGYNVSLFPQFTTMPAMRSLVPAIFPVPLTAHFTSC